MEGTLNWVGNKITGDNSNEKIQNESELKEQEMKIIQLQLQLEEMKFLNSEIQKELQNKEKECSKPKKNKKESKKNYVKEIIIIDDWWNYYNSNFKIIFKLKWFDKKKFSLFF